MEGKIRIKIKRNGQYLLNRECKNFITNNYVKYITEDDNISFVLFEYNGTIPSTPKEEAEFNITLDDVSSYIIFPFSDVNKSFFNIPSASPKIKYKLLTEISSNFNSTHFGLLLENQQIIVSMVSFNFNFQNNDYMEVDYEVNIFPLTSVSKPSSVIAKEFFKNKNASIELYEFDYADFFLKSPAIPYKLNPALSVSLTPKETVHVPSDFSINNIFSLVYRKFLNLEQEHVYMIKINNSFYPLFFNFYNNNCSTGLSEGSFIHGYIYDSFMITDDDFFENIYNYNSLRESASNKGAPYTQLVYKNFQTSCDYMKIPFDKIMVVKKGPNNNFMMYLKQVSMENLEINSVIPISSSISLNDTYFENINDLYYLGENNYIIYLNNGVEFIHSDENDILFVDYINNIPDIFLNYGIEFEKTDVSFFIKKYNNELLDYIYEIYAVRLNNDNIYVIFSKNYWKEDQDISLYSFIGKHVDIAVSDDKDPIILISDTSENVKLYYQGNTISLSLDGMPDSFINSNNIIRLIHIDDQHTYVVSYSLDSSVVYFAIVNLDTGNVTYKNITLSDVIASKEIEYSYYQSLFIFKTSGGHEIVKYDILNDTFFTYSVSDSYLIYLWEFNSPNETFFIAADKGMEVRLYSFDKNLNLIDDNWSELLPSNGPIFSALHFTSASSYYTCDDEGSIVKQFPDIYLDNKMGNESKIIFRNPYDIEMGVLPNFASCPSIILGCYDLVLSAYTEEWFTENNLVLRLSINPFDFKLTVVPYLNIGNFYYSFGNSKILQLSYKDNVPIKSYLPFNIDQSKILNIFPVYINNISFTLNTYIKIVGESNPPDVSDFLIFEYDPNTTNLKYSGNDTLPPDTYIVTVVVIERDYIP